MTFVVRWACWCSCLHLEHYPYCYGFIFKPVCYNTEFNDWSNLAWAHRFSKMSFRRLHTAPKRSYGLLFKNSHDDGLDRFWQISSSLKFHKVSTSSDSVCITQTLHWQWLYCRCFTLYSPSVTKNSGFVNTGKCKHQFSHSLTRPDSIQRLQTRSYSSEQCYSHLKHS